jgi:hypothetical protein
LTKCADAIWVSTSEHTIDLSLLEVVDQMRRRNAGVHF